jgi:NAD(P)-dependent dehydrogenase (short-subunit alcohol dehydrogenase family)
VLRDGLLAGTAVVVAGAGALGEAVAARAAALGAQVDALAVDPHGEEPAFHGTAGVLVWDGSEHGARAALDGAWLAVRPVARAMSGEPRPSGPGSLAGVRPGGETSGRGGCVILLAPAPGDAEAEAARAGLENMARTLSVEWARFQIRTVAVLPGPSTTADEVAELVAFLASRAGAYYSGCAFELGAAEAR